MNFDAREEVVIHNDLVSEMPVRKIKVMRIIARMNVGGPAVQISGLMRHFDTNRFEQILVTGYCAEDESDYLETSATDVSATRIEGLGRSISLFGDLKALFKLVNLIRTFKPDIVHTHTAKAGVLGRIASILSGHKSIRIHTFHGHLLHGYFGKFKTLLVIYLERALALSTTKIFAVGSKVKDDLVNVKIAPKDKFIVMPPGLELREMPTRQEALKSLGLDPSKIFCSFIGRITQIKRPDRFLSVVENSKKRNLNLHFIVAGAGDLLEETIANSKAKDLPITFLGWREDIETILSASDIVILTSDNEGMPLSLIQAGMAGKPVVTTNVGSVEEIVKDGVSGYITDFNPDQLSNSLEKLSTDPDLRNSMGKAAVELTTTNFGVMRLVNNHQEIYQSLTSNKS
jgi:glycosyltransferase involved in cell wall biosynthesis